MADPREARRNIDPQETARESEPLIVEFGKPFHIRPNVNRDTIPDYVTAESRDQYDNGLLVDFIEFKDKNSALSGSIGVLSIDLIDDDRLEMIREPMGTARPITFEVEVYGVTEEDENSDTVGAEINAGGEIFSAEMEYLYDSDGTSNGAWARSWLDKDKNYVGFAFPPSAASAVVFTVFTKPTE